MPYREINLDTNEAFRVVPPLEIGVPIDPLSGGIIAALPGAGTRPCPGDALDGSSGEPLGKKAGEHAPECLCGGVGWIPVRRPSIEPVDAADDGLPALEAALAQRDAEDMERINPALGDTLPNLMRRDVANRTSSGSGSNRTKQVDPKRLQKFQPHPSVEDGRLELRGRPPRFKDAGTRSARIVLSVAPETVELLEAKNDDLANVVESLMAEPEFAAALAEVKGQKVNPAA